MKCHHLAAKHLVVKIADATVAVELQCRARLKGRLGLWIVPREKRAGERERFADGTSPIGLND